MSLDIPFGLDDTDKFAPRIDQPCIIYLGKDGEHEAIVDEDDYAYLMQWRWNFKISSSHFSHRVYARRTEWVRREDGSRYSNTILMHNVVLERAGQEKPAGDHWTGDHRNRKSLDNRRKNLRWATKATQTRNRRRNGG